MNLLLDTHPFLWWAGGSARLSAESREAILDPQNLVSVSAASIWEAEIKAEQGRLEVAGGELLEEARRIGFHVIDMTADDSVAAGRLPRHHGDSFDRMLVAQAQRRGLTLVTRDARLGAYGVATLLA